MDYFASKPPEGFHFKDILYEKKDMIADQPPGILQLLHDGHPGRTRHGHRRCLVG